MATQSKLQNRSPVKSNRLGVVRFTGFGVKEFEDEFEDWGCGLGLYRV